MNNLIQKDGKLEEVKVLFKAFEKKKTRNKIEYKASTNYDVTKFNVKYEELSAKEINL